MCCRSEWQERMYIYKWHEVDQTKHEIFCVHIVCNEIQVKVNLEITTFFFYLRFPYCPNFFWFGVVYSKRKTVCDASSMSENDDPLLPARFWSVHLMDTLLSPEAMGKDLWCWCWWVTWQWQHGGWRTCKFPYSYLDRTFFNSREVSFNSNVLPMRPYVLLDATFSDLS